MSCHKGFAPCLRVTEGDRRVTGLTMDFTHQVPSDFRKVAL